MSLNFLHSLYMPWWAWLYIAIVSFMYAVGIFFDKDSARAQRVVSLLSLFSICLCVLGFFNVSISDALGFAFIPIVAAGLYWEFSQAVQDTARAQREIAGDAELDDWERDTLLNVGVAMNAALVVPGYMFGVVLCVRLLGGAV